MSVWQVGKQRHREGEETCKLTSPSWYRYLKSCSDRFPLLAYFEPTISMKMRSGHSHRSVSSIFLQLHHLTIPSKMLLWTMGHSKSQTRQKFKKEKQTPFFLTGEFSRKKGFASSFPMTFAQGLFPYLESFIRLKSFSRSSALGIFLGTT